MQLENSFVVPVPVEEAWRVLLDVERVAPCMPGATLDSVDGDDMTGRVKVKVGPITMTYRGTARFASLDHDAHVAVLEASGKEARGSGTARATVRTSLVARGDETEVRVTTDLTVTGRPAQFGRGVLADVSAKLIGQFADCLAAEVRDHAAHGHGDEPAGSIAKGEVAPAQATVAPSASDPVVPSPVERPTAPVPTVPIRTSSTPARSATDGRRTNARRSVDAIDLVGTAGVPIAKRVLPVVAALLVLWLVVRVAKRR